MQLEDDGPTLARGTLRVGTLLAVVALIIYLFWDLYSENAALNRLSATAAKYVYSERCNAEGDLIATGPPNCVDLNHYVFVYGPISRALRRACTGKAQELLVFEDGKVARTEINRVERMLKFRAQYGVNAPC